MTDHITFTVPSFSIPYSGKQLTDTLRLNQFQAEIYKLLGKERDILVTAPTGGGKTLSLLLNPDNSGGVSGFVALYPNNTLLVNQLCTVEDVIIEHFGAQLVETAGLCETGICNGSNGVRRRCECSRRNPESDCIEPLTIYKVDESKIMDSWDSVAYIALLTVSGRYIVSQGLPKREVLYGIARKVLKYRRQGGIYVIVFATPDTYLLLSTGAYRDFEGVGKTIHNMLLAIAEDKDLETVLRETGVLARGLVDETISVVQRLMNQPLFIDEFHLYGPYELDALYAMLILYKRFIGKPVVFSSATPAEDILAELKGAGVNPVRVIAQTASGLKGFPVRGETRVTLIPIPTRRKGMPAYFEASSSVPGIVADRLIEKITKLRDGRVLIVLERLWMVSELAWTMSSRGLDVECIASIVPRDACKSGSRVIVGSEATTQGVNLGKVVLGVTGGASSEDVIQRIGRIGRRGVDSEVYLVLPEYAIASYTLKGRMSYWEFVAIIKNLYPDYPKRKRDVSRIIPGWFHELRRKLIVSLGLASIARVSGIRQVYDMIALSKKDAIEMLNGVVGSPQVYTDLLLFRRTGFTVGYLVAGTNDRGETSIGLITRNFRVMHVTKNGRLVIELTRARKPLRIKVLGDPAPFARKFVSLKRFLRSIKGRVEIGEEHSLEEDQVEDTLVYVTDAGEELSEYLSYTGEGAEILSASGRRYAVIFV